MLKPQFENGLHDITNDEYHGSQGVSRSALWLYKQSPKHYWHRYLNPDYTPPKPSAAFALGNLIHTLVLEPSEIDDRYFVMNKVSRATKVGKEAHANALHYAGHREIVMTDDMAAAQAMAKLVLNDDMAKGLFVGSDVEKSIYFTHEPTGLQCKVRPDAMIGGVITDLKTVKDGSYRPFQNSAFQYGYFLQAAMIKAAVESLGVEFQKFIFYCVEKVEPYACTYYLLDDEALEYGEHLFNKLMGDYAESLKADAWDSYEPKILSIPHYAQYED